MQTRNIFPGPIRGLIERSSACPVERKKTPPMKKGRVQSIQLPLRPGAVPNETILEMRGMYEFQGWGQKALSEKFGFPYRYVRDVVNYQIRSKLIPEREKFPGDKDRFAVKVVDTVA